MASWSSVDYYGRWKPLQFYARRAYTDVLVSPYLKESDKAIGVRVVSDSDAPSSSVPEGNFITIVPGYEYIVNVRTQASADAFLAKLRYQSLNDIMK